MASESPLLQLASSAQKELGMIPGTRFYTPFPFSGMNVQDSGIGIDDKEFRYIENFFRLGNGKLRAGWDIGKALYKAAAGKTILSFFSYNIGLTNYFAVFLTDGTAYQVNASTSAVTTISSVANTFYQAGGSFPACAQWGTLYLIIANRNTPNNYWIWEPAGIANPAILFTAGTIAPGLIPLLANGLNYTSLPTVTAYGGSGSGVVVVPTINAGGVLELNITNPGSGYEVGDVVQLAFSGGGSDTSAILQANLAQAGSGASLIALPNGHGLWDGGSSPSNVEIASGGSGYTTPTVVANYTLSGVPTQLAATSVTVTAGVITGVVFPATAEGSKPVITNVSIVVTPVGGTGTVVSVNMTSGGSAYSSAPAVAFTGSGGSGAAGTAIISGGVVTSVMITNPGSGYTSAPAVGFSGGGGSGAAATASITASSVTGVTVVNAGSGFQYAPPITFVGGGGSGASGVIELTGTTIARVNVVAGGTGFNHAPTVAFTGGGGGSGAAATAVIANGQVVQINVTNAGSGYTTQPAVEITPSGGDTASGAAAFAILNPTTISSVLMSNYGSGYTSAPGVVISPGANNSAYAGIVPLMPYGISGDSIETFLQRVWIFNPAQGQFDDLPPSGDFAVSAPESLTDFATSDGGLLYTSTDSFLQTKYTGVRQSNGYLYAFGDGSVSVISNVQANADTTTGLVTTTFNYQNVDPQIGMSWRDSRQDFSRTLIFANQTGIYGLYGGAVTNISAKLQDLFLNALFPPTAGALTPSSASATVFDVRHYMMLLTITDPHTNLPRNVMACWNEREWTLASQGVNLTYIGTQKVSSQLYAWGTDGLALYPLFAKPSATLIKRFDTKLYGTDSSYVNKNFLDFYLQASDVSSGKSGIAFTALLDIGGIATQNTENPNMELASVPSEQLTGAGLIAPPNFAAGSNTLYYPVFGVGTGGCPFIIAGMEFTSNSPDFVVGNLLMAYHPLSVNQ